MRPIYWFGTASLLALSPVALAHTGAHPVEGFVSGFIHPFLGTDHLLAMIAVGLWAVTVAPRRVWLLPLAFMAVMGLGGWLGAAGTPLAHTETGVAASVVLLGLLVAGKVRLSQFTALSLVGLFALFHGYAHGAEIGLDAKRWTYAVGFITATGLLHLTGVILGVWLLAKPAWYRSCGAAMGAMGLALLTQTL
ncbi:MULTISPECIES: HupE/UreJ family protein [Methylococcus]|uniref:HupE/UreJ family protein n=1 Tax=Methylococcus capsulatus TaxID=414 RepID=A0ABZ2F924_METCP|nr:MULTISPECIES: HupE/UreJ family protein [Methylococcus]MDF9392744.1 HupE/UreJ family protein [Methylococcus capsulatus]